MSASDSQTLMGVLIFPQPYRELYNLSRSAPFLRIGAERGRSFDGLRPGHVMREQKRRWINSLCDDRAHPI
jgi:hypothetical protein